MDLRLFLSTFVMIFFAELGDKTQLAAMAQAAGGRSTWSVFAGASAALVFSTLLAVLGGSLLQKLVPPHVIKLVAGALFLLFGVLLIWNALGTREPTAAAAVTAPAAPAARPGLIGRLVLEAAARFEEAAAADYDALAASVENPALQRLFRTLAGEERQHLGHVRALAARPEPAVPGDAVADLPRFLRTDGELPDREKEILAAAIRQEQAKVDFYTRMAESAVLPGLKSTFLSLADEEADHVRRLESAARA